MKGSIELARLICVEIAGEPVPNDTDGDSYGSIEIAEILSAGYERLKAENKALKTENEALKSRISGGVRVYAFEAWGEYKCDQYGKPNATLLLDDAAISKSETPGEH